MSTRKPAAAPAATEVKASTEPVKTAEKPVSEKKSAAKTAKPAAEKKPAAAKSAKTAKTAKPAAEKATAAKTEAKAASAKKAPAKSAAKAAPKAAAAKKPAKKAASVVSNETICAKLEKMISKTKVASIKEKIAVDIEIYGFTEGEASQKMYIEVNEGKAVVSPHSYESKDFRIAISVDKAAAFVDGKLTLKELIAGSEGFYAEGNIAKAVKLAAVF